MADDLVEIRFNGKRSDAQVFMAVMKARNATKDMVGQEMLRAWAALRRHEAMMIERLTRGNGDDSQSGFGSLGE